MGKKAHHKKKTTQKNNDILLSSGSKYSNSESPQIEDELANETSDQQDLFNKRESALQEEVSRLKAQLECAFKIRQMLQDEVISLKNKQNEELPKEDKEQENEILKLRQQVKKEERLQKS